MSGKRPRPRKRDEFHDKKQELLWAWSDEVCNNDELPEVEIVSLLQENIPKYRLRADSLTQFGGYENQDWFIPSPALPLSDADLKLSPDQIRETLNYFLLCSNRVSQMTKTYNDIEAVTRLLEEKEKDLELTARIGKELLSANGRLESRVNSLEGELRGARDIITQLRHELHTKSELLQVLTNDTEESPVEEKEDSIVAVGALRRRTGALERENIALREEAARLAAGTDSAELAERQLLRDIAHQLASANSEASVLGNELINERERSSELQYQLDSANTRLAVTERSLQQLTVEHEHTLRILEITKENQNALAAELADAKDRYAEVAAHLGELQEQLRQLRKKGEPHRGLHGLMPHVAAAAGLGASLHREMHSSIYSELSLDSGIGDSTQQTSMHKIFETVQCASRPAGSSRSGSDVPDAAPRLALPPRTATRSDDSYLEESSDTDNDDVYPGGWGGSGVPGAPGAAELAAALKRLTPQEINGRRALLMASHASKRTSLTGVEMGESVGESAVWGSGTGTARWRAPTKLQIVKPMEGSLTLHTWAQLAKPTMSGILEEQEGVGVRGARSSNSSARLYRLSDVEEDDDMGLLPQANYVYTYTNSTVMHPNDGSLFGSVCSSISSSAQGSALSSLSSSVLGSAWSSRATSPQRSRRTSVSQAPKVPETPARRFSPTATPANSPLLGSPDQSPPGTPTTSHSRPPSLHSLIAMGRKYLATPAGADSPSPLTLQTPGSLYTGLVHRSPMEQLTCLKRTLRSPAEPKEDTPSVPTSTPKPLGVPAQTGSGALSGSPPSANGTMRRGSRVARPRTDLGTVGAVPTPAPVAPRNPSPSPLGTLGTLLFGRKGGLM